MPLIVLPILQLFHKTFSEFTVSGQTHSRALFFYNIIRFPFELIHPAPRFSRTPGAIQGPPPLAGEHSAEALADWGFSAEEIASLQDAQAI